MEPIELTREEWLDAANHAFPTGGNSSDGHTWAGIGEARGVAVLLVEYSTGVKTASVIDADVDSELSAAIDYIDELDLAYYGDDAIWED